MNSEKEIIEQSEEIYYGAGIYFLIENGEVVYVGQSVYPLHRVGSHIKSKTFDRYTIIPCDISEMNDLEAACIVKFKPKLNTGLPSNARYKSIEFIKKFFGLDAWKVKKFLARNRISPVIFNSLYDMEEVKGAADREALQQIANQ